ncbi:hypothetical protein [Thioalkalivibrio sp. ALJ7]|uniref:hypothetical protein n=1 Tax=Thioalkalivibrio sp. ALJ7 TaxID=1158756 RepID=UPI000369BA91|nr:hypothetical protein [Thioalkalivibrio sp. ALJ7]
MISEAKNADLIGKWLRHIQSEETEEAFVFLVGRSAALVGYECFPEAKGDVRDFRFYRDGTREQPFAFIVNRKWLLFYFRAPAVQGGAYGFKHLQAEFDSAAENTAGEWTVKIRSLCDAKRLWRLLALQ